MAYFLCFIGVYYQLITLWNDSLTITLMHQVRIGNLNMNMHDGDSTCTQVMISLLHDEGLMYIQNYFILIRALKSDLCSYFQIPWKLKFTA